MAFFFGREASAPEGSNALILRREGIVEARNAPDCGLAASPRSCFRRVLWPRATDWVPIRASAPFCARFEDARATYDGLADVVLSPGFSCKQRRDPSTSAAVSTACALAETARDPLRRACPISRAFPAKLSSPMVRLRLDRPGTPRRRTGENPSENALRGLRRVSRFLNPRVARRSGRVADPKTHALRADSTANGVSGLKQEVPTLLPRHRRRPRSRYGPTSPRRVRNPEPSAISFFI